MAAGSNRWESDPLFSAAEVVQDSADRMESLLRIVLHQQSLVNGDVLDPKFHHSIECHRRDLVTALETTKWQLEDFERALYVSPSSNKSHLRRDVSSRHSQFVRAIREQIAGVEQSLEDSPTKDITGNQNWVNLNKHDRDGLALFLSGGESMDNKVRYDVENGILRSFLDPNSNGDEIVELKTEELEGLEVNDVKNSEEKNKSRNVESHYPKQFSSEQPPEVSDGDRNCEVWADSRELDLELGNSGEKFSSSDNRVKRFVGYLSSFSLPIVNKMNRSFTKKRKDGEVLDDYAANVEGRTLSICHDMSQVEQVIGVREIITGFHWALVLEHAMDCVVVD
ncbi:hypothetical protein QJS10_CPA08g01478 [Acorus calamus]|uniref:Syntaxin 6/10/61 N-terminal domain-containing protein n=1 Tax=Acorus calamus TaxID=4465 RepID=A0AAV9EAQ7_ACOCL|nr:hypothetical protein QJS10_CPA08g01478 [Acorus calamus]